MAISLGYYTLTSDELESLKSNSLHDLNIETLIYSVSDVSYVKQGRFVCRDDTGNWYSGMLSWNGNSEKTAFGSGLFPKPHPLYELMNILRVSSRNANCLMLWRYLDKNKDVLDGDGR